MGHPRLAVVMGMVVGLGAVLGSGAARSAALSQEPPIAGEGVAADYLRSLHAQIHPLWSGLYVHEKLDKLPAGRPDADSSRQAVLLFSVRWDGSAADVTMVQESGVAAFDEAARTAIRRVDRFPVPPLAVLSDDGLAHFRWVMARDERLCSGGLLLRFEAPPEEAVPHLLNQGRVEEALWRVARWAAEADSSRSSEDPLALFARAWLSRPQTDPVADGKAAAALARLGDDRQLPRLRAALQRRDTVIDAALALRGLRVDLCPLVQGALGAGNPAAREVAMLALDAAGGRLPPTSPCVEALGATVADRALDGTQRALAARALAAISADGARRQLSSLVGDESPSVRAAAISSLARPGGGRPALYRWLPYLHDPSIEVRAAAAATLIRSCGDLALDQLVLVWKEPDPQVGVAVARELARMRSAASEAFLVRLAKRRDPAVRAATAKALAARRDLAAHAGKAAVTSAAAGDSGADAAGGTPPVGTRSPSVRIVAGLGRRAAAEWVLTNFYRLDQAELIELFGSWLAAPAHTNLAREPAPVSVR